MKSCAFLTMDSLDGYVSDDELAIAPLAKLGWSVESVPWRRSGVRWREFDLVVVRSAWDYHRDPEAFLAVLKTIDRSTRLENPLELLRWNARKSYLQDLLASGVPVVPTYRGDRLDERKLSSVCRRLGCDEVVIKPVVGANAEDTFRLSAADPTSRTDGPATRAAALETFRDRAYLAQPFQQGVVEEGEFSVVFVAGELSHAILKTPRPSDFRVQEEHGGTIRAVTPEPLLAKRARAAIAWLDPEPLYGRADLVRSAGGDFLVMELELIEPSLYLRMDAEAPRRFAAAIEARARP